MFKWIPHYTGSEFAKTNWYFARRETSTKRLRFFRWERPMIGVFIGYTNHLTLRGFELCTSNLHCGVLTARLSMYSKLFRVEWSGSGVDPFHAYTLVFWRFFIGSTADFWLKRLMERRSARKMREWEEEMERNYFERQTEGN